MRLQPKSLCQHLPNQALQLLQIRLALHVRQAIDRPPLRLCPLGQTGKLVLLLGVAAQQQYLLRLVL
jgi:hypothetical protein